MSIFCSKHAINVLLSMDAGVEDVGFLALATPEHRRLEIGKKRTSISSNLLHNCRRNVHYSYYRVLVI